MPDDRYSDYTTVMFCSSCGDLLPKPIPLPTPCPDCGEVITQANDIIYGLFLPEEARVLTACHTAPNAEGGSDAA